MSFDAYLDQLLPHFNELLAQLPDDASLPSSISSSVPLLQERKRYTHDQSHVSSSYNISAAPTGISSISTIGSSSHHGHHSGYSGGHSSAVGGSSASGAAAAAHDINQGLTMASSSDGTMMPSISGTSMVTPSSLSSISSASSSVPLSSPMLLSALNDQWLPSTYSKPSFSKSGYTDVQWSLSTSIASSSSSSLPMMVASSSSSHHGHHHGQSMSISSSLHATSASANNDAYDEPYDD